MKQQDALQRFIFEDTDIRGEIVRLNQSFQTIMQQHQYPRQVFNSLAETLVASVLLSATLKYHGQLTVQFQSEGTIKLLVAKCNQQLDIRGLAQFETAAISKKQNDYLLSEGQLVITVEPDDKVKPYQSIVPLQKKSIAANLEDYFGQSVQIPTKLYIAVNQTAAVGMLLQLLPGKSQAFQYREQFWEHATKLGETITDAELLTLDNETILYRLYHQEKVRLFEPESIQFRCNCSRKRMENVIAMLGKTETDAILAEKQIIDITCEYCKKVYSFDRIDVGAILPD